MRFSLIAVLALAKVSESTVFINEIHYDNSGSDTGEFVEVAGPAMTDVTGYSILLYNGNGGGTYATINLSGIIPDQMNGYGTLSFDQSGIQNGSPDGLCLVDESSNALEFLSYEGSFAAVGGACDGLVSTDIGVSEPTDTPVGFSLQLGGMGITAGDFNWESPQAETKGQVNQNQNFGTGGTTASPPTTTSATTTSNVKTIDDIQGNDFESGIIGETVTVQNAIVTMIRTPNSPIGFYMQQGDEDQDPTTSTGIFVFTGTSDPPGVSVGDIVTVVGTVGTFKGLTQISTTPTAVAILSSGNALPAPVPVALPVADLLELEAVEGMLVEFQPAQALNKKLVVSEYFNLDRYGEIVVCAADATLGRVFQYTQFSEPSQPGFAAFEDELSRSCIEADDNWFGQNPDPVDLNGALVVDKTNLLRGGSEVTGFVGVVMQQFGGSTSDGSSDDFYRVLPVVFDIDQATNPRPTTPPVLDDNSGIFEFKSTRSTSTSSKSTRGKFTKFVIANVLNYFTSIDPFSCFSPYRGADGDGGDLGILTEEFDRQAKKTTTALGELDADVYGLVEVENFNYGAVLDLAARLNAETGKTFRVATVEAGISRAGTDAIRVDVLYNARELFLKNVCVLTDDVIADLGLLPGNDEPVFDGVSTNRNPVAVTLSYDRRGRRSVTLVMNHFKSKGGTGTGADADMGDGAGNWNFRRTQAAEAVIAWINHDEFCGNKDSVVIAGDLNAYAKEDPIQVIEDEGFVSVKDLTATDPPEYSFVFNSQWGTLDYAFVRNCFAEKVKGSATWHVNADEPDLFDYNLDFGRNPNLFDGETPYRFSDHDPLIFEMTFPSERETCI